MSKNKKTISSLLANRPKGRFASEGFDLLGEGKSLLGSPTLLREKRGMDKKNLDDANSDISELEVSRFDVLKSGTSRSDNAKCDASESDVSHFGISKNGASVSGDEDELFLKGVLDRSRGGGVSDFDIPKSDNAKSDILKSDTSKVSAGEPGGSISNISSSDNAKSDIPNFDISGIRASVATREYYKNAKKELDQLSHERRRAFELDSYIVDTLIREVGNPSAILVYIYLWRRTVGEGRGEIQISTKILAEALGLSRGTAKKAIVQLNEMKLVVTGGMGELCISTHRVLQPWR